MKKIAAALLGITTCSCAPSSAQIKVPYFKDLSNQEVCLGFNRYCQPNSSLSYHRVRGADFQGLSDWLGTSYEDSAFQRTPCVAPFLEASDVRISGEHLFSGTVDNTYAGDLHSVLKVDLAKYLGAVLSVLPIGLQARLEADATDKLTMTGTGKADFVYRRYDLTMAALSRLLPDCYKGTRGQRKVVTGVSVITMSGEWARRRLVDSFGTFEASAEFIGLSPDVKAAYTDKRDRTMAGKFQPLSFVIATSWRKSD